MELQPRFFRSNGPLQREIMRIILMVPETIWQISERNGLTWIKCCEFLQKCFSNQMLFLYVRFDRLSHAWLYFFSNRLYYGTVCTVQGFFFSLVRNTDALVVGHMFLIMFTETPIAHLTPPCTESWVDVSVSFHCRIVLLFYVSLSIWYSLHTKWE